MAAAENYIKTWYNNNQSQLTQTLIDLQKYALQWPEKYAQLDDSRRRVSGYFQSVYNLWQQTKLLDDLTAHGALDERRVKFYLDYAEPLEWAKIPSYSREIFNFYISEYHLAHRPLPDYPAWFEEIGYIGSLDNLKSRRPVAGVAPIP